MPVAAIAGTVLGGVMGNNSAQKTADEQAAGTDASNKLQWQMLQQTRADNATRMQAGDNALARLMQEAGFGVTDNGQGSYGVGGDNAGSYVEGSDSLHGPGHSIDQMLGTEKAFGSLGGLFGGQLADPLGLFGSSKKSSYWTPPGVQNTQRYSFNPTQTGNKLFSGFTADPGYQFRLEQGNRGINNSLAARGGLLSGNAIKAAADYNSGQASNEYNNYINRLQTLAGFGTGATNNVTNATMNTSANLGNNIANGFNARASGYAAQGQNTGNMINSLANLYGQYQTNKNFGGSSYGGDTYSNPKAAYELW